MFFRLSISEDYHFIKFQKKKQKNRSLTLQATSTFIGLPPKSVGNELGEEGLVCGALEDAAFSQRWRKRVTSSWSSIVFMCLKEKKKKRDEDQKLEVNIVIIRHFK